MEFHGEEVLCGYGWAIACRFALVWHSAGTRLHKACHEGVRRMMRARLAANHTHVVATTKSLTAALR